MVLWRQQLVDMLKRTTEPTLVFIVGDALFLVHVLKFVRQNKELHRHARGNFACFHRCARRNGRSSAVRHCRLYGVDIS